MPIVCHGLSLSLASTRKIDPSYLEALKQLLDEIDAPWFSDHLCLSGAHSANYHDLIPALRTRESLKNVVNRVRYIQSKIARPFAIENISYYANSKHNSIEEHDFINEILDQSGAYLLLDINNVYVNSKNFNFDAKKFLRNLNNDRVIQIHLAGHFKGKDYIIDTHGEEVSQDVWELYKWYIGEQGRPITTMIEWDQNVPDFSVLLNEVNRAKDAATSALGVKHAS